MSAHMASLQEEEVMVLATLKCRGESTRDEVAGELGVRSVFRTLVRLETDQRVSSRDRYNATLQRRERVFRLNDAMLRIDVQKPEAGNGATHVS